MKSENYSLMNLEKLNIQEEMNYSCDTMLHIYPTANMDYSVLTDREKSILERPHPTDVGWGFYGLAPVKPR